MKTTPRWVALAAVVLAAARQGHADGWFVSVKTTQLGQSTSLVASPKQEAILATDGQTVQVVLRTHFNAGPKELGWVVPVPDVPDDVGKADDAIFDRLEALTVPTFLKREVSPREDIPIGFGCGVKANRWGAAGAESSLAVRVEKAGKAGIFDFQVVSAQRVEDLLQWLDRHNYNPPTGADRAFAPYVAKGWHWLAVRVRAEEAGRPTLAPHPVTYRYKSRPLVFPLIISSISAADETEIVLYVVGAGYFGPADWTGCTCDDLALRGRDGALVELKGSPSGTNYEALLRRRARRLAGRLLVTEFAHPWQLFGTSAVVGRRFDDVLEPNLLASIGPGQTLTRLRACVRREQMDQDILLSPAPGAREVDNRIEFTPPAPASAATTRPARASSPILGLAALSAFAAGGLGCRPTRAAQALRALLVALGLALLAVL